MGKRFLAPVITAAVGVVLSAAMSAYVQDDIERDAESRFERQAADARHVIERRLHSYVGVTYGLRALFASRGDMLGRAEFHRYVESLDLKRDFPGYEVLNYARHIRARDKERLEEEVRRDTSLDPRGYSAFVVRPPGEREAYHVLIYLAPMEANRFALGLDIASVEAAARVIGQQRDTGELISSGRLLNVGKDRSVGLAMRLAVYRNGLPLATLEQRRAAFVGTVGAGYNVRKLMSGVLDETTMVAMRYRFYDAGPIDDARPAALKPSLLFDSVQTAPGAPQDDFAVAGSGPTFEAVLPFELARRKWELRFSAPKSAFITSTDAWLPGIVLAGGLLSTGLLFALIYAFASSRERAVAMADGMTRELRASQSRLEASAAQIRELLRRLVSVQEAERRRFSADLHDLVGQSLSVIGIGLETIRGLLPGTAPQKAEAAIRDMGQVVRETMGAVREVMSDLRPPLLDDYGLTVALEWHAQQLESRTGLRVAVEGDRLEPRPASEVEVALFRIAQEALTNVAKHAGASRVTVALSSSAGRVTLVIEDDGRGIDAAAANDPAVGSWGMAVMRERAVAVGGTMRVETPGRGTRVVVEVAA